MGYKLHFEVYIIIIIYDYIYEEYYEITTIRHALKYQNIKRNNRCLSVVWFPTDLFSLGGIILLPRLDIRKMNAQIYFSKET